ncbi:MAG: hypothetical protein AB8I08_29060 [Sandaracinaceae bacterium]
MSRDALRGAAWMLAAGLAVTGVTGFIRALSVGGGALMPSAVIPITVAAGLLVLVAKGATAVLLLSRLARDEPAKPPPWLPLILLIAFGLTGVVLNLGSGAAMAYVVQRAMDLGALADFSMTQSIVGAVGNVAHPLIDVGTLIGAAWLWQSRAKAPLSETTDPA